MRGRVFRRRNAGVRYQFRVAPFDQVTGLGNDALQDFEKFAHVGE
jgi:hypothetical protein